MDDYYTVKDAAYICGLSEKTVYGYIKAGKLQAAKVGAVWRIPGAAIETLLSGGSGIVEQNRRPANRGKQGARAD